MRYLTIALAKGRLGKIFDIFESMGIDCAEMRDKDTRKLIFTNEEHKIKFFLAKASDVPTYVEYGAADIGVVGKDNIIQHKVDLTADDGRTDYGVCDDYISLLTCDMYRKCVYILEKYNPFHLYEGRINPFPEVLLFPSHSRQYYLHQRPLSLQYN